MLVRVLALLGTTLVACEDASALRVGMLRVLAVVVHLRRFSARAKSLISLRSSDVATTLTYPLTSHRVSL